MEIGGVREVLLWCSLVNLVLLTVWAVALMAAGDRVYRLHSRFFRIERTAFDTVHYAGLTFFKLFVFVVNVVPCAVLYVTG